MQPAAAMSLNRIGHSLPWLGRGTGRRLCHEDVFTDWQSWETLSALSSVSVFSGIPRELPWLCLAGPLPCCAEEVDLNKPGQFSLHKP